MNIGIGIYNASFPIERARSDGVIVSPLRLRRIGRRYYIFDAASATVAEADVQEDSKEAREWFLNIVGVRYGVDTI